MENSYTAKYVSFKGAVPVWAKGREKEMNLWLSFKAKTNTKSAILRITGSSAYNVYAGGKFVAFGPARCAHGFFRVDEIDLSEYLKESNTVIVTVAGYNCNSFYHIDQPSFFCAEIEENGKITSATGKNGFVCRECTEHERKALRYSFQRTFAESYRLTPEIAAWSGQDGDAGFAPVELAQTEPKKFISRGCGLNVYYDIPAKEILSYEKFSYVDHSGEFRYPYWIRSTSENYKHFETSEVDTDCALIARNLDITSSIAANEAPHAVKLGENDAVTFSMGREYTGKIAFDVKAENDAEIALTFDEYLDDGNYVNFRHLCCNSIIIKMKAGSYEFSTFEPYSLSVLRVFAISGETEISNVHMIYFGAEDTERKYAGNDSDIAKIFDAAVQTYRQNTFTIYMDCPSRERAGWLCDSFFTSRVEKILTGKSEIEHNFLENFFLPDSFENIPKGMFPMCYPADHCTGNFIPNWAMWLVIELEEYFGRTSDAEFIKSAKPRIYGLLDYFEKFENADGLLEKLEKWVFVEWSKSNELTQDINYPTNMLYSRMLRSVAALYGDIEKAEKADRIARVINEQAFTEDGFYCDNAVYGDDGVARLSGKCTESCQYYAFFCGIATPDTRAELWQRLLYDFGPGRIIPGSWPNLCDDAKWQSVYPANAFIGNYLRLELLFIYGEREKLLENIKGYFKKMADFTGTLWESELKTASCNHGFASHVIYWLDGMGLIK
ncbi:MAG: hypothetical protein KBS59_00930 [Clostridiales bacterium]|nr:hypothetical protein [Clostridiales bacterium]